MDKNKIVPFFSDKEFLNPKISPSTGNVAAFIGEFPEDAEPLSMWLRIADCHQSITLHKCDWDDIPDFVVKLHKLRDFIDRFINEITKYETYKSNIRDN
jgi:hypothetical protein